MVIYSSQGWFLFPSVYLIIFKQGKAGGVKKQFYPTFIYLFSSRNPFFLSYFFFFFCFVSRIHLPLVQILEIESQKRNASHLLGWFYLMRCFTLALSKSEGLRAGFPSFTPFEKPQPNPGGVNAIVLQSSRSKIKQSSGIFSPWRSLKKSERKGKRVPGYGGTGSTRGARVS